MDFIKKNFAVLILMILLCFGSFDDVARAQSGDQLELDPARISWTDLSFNAKNFWVEVSTGVQLRSLEASELDNFLPASHEGEPIKPLTPEVAEMIIHTTIAPKGRSPVSIDNRIWFNPMDASALGRIWLRRGEDDFKKIYRFMDRGVFRHRIEPKNKSEARLEPDEWTDIKDSFYPYDMNQINCPCVSERSALIYILSAVAMSKSDTPQKICVFGKRQLHRVRLQKEGIHPIKVDYIEKKQEKEIRKDSIIKALKMVITAQPVSPLVKDAENFSFMGFQKDISVYIKPASGLPVYISGIIPTVGKADLKLQKAWVKE